MRTLLPLCIIGLGWFSISAQNLVVGEYFWDTDPGVGQGVEVQLSGAHASDSVVITQDLIVHDLGSGIHSLCFRVRDDLGNWSLTNCRRILVQPGPGESPVLFLGGESFIDEDPGHGRGIAFSFESREDSIAMLDSVSVSNLTQGFHQLCVRLLDSEGNWGKALCRTFYLGRTEETVAPPIISAEYFWNTEPGQGEGVPLVVPSSDSVSIAPALTIDSLSLGTHTISLRYKDALGKWSFIHAIPFEVCTLDPPVAGFDFIQTGQRVSIIDTSKRTQRYFWDFGDENTRSIAYPKHTYEAPGTYAVTQIVSNECGIDTAYKNVQVTGVNSYFPHAGGDSGRVTLQFNGAFFSDRLTVNLSRGNGDRIYPIDSLIRVEGDTLTKATFDLSNQPHGLWDIEIEVAGDTLITIEDGFLIEEAYRDLQLSLLIPEFARITTTELIYVNYKNTGNVDITSPTGLIFNVEQTPIAFREDELSFNLTALPLSFFNDSSRVLGAGEEGSIPVYAKVEGDIRLQLLGPTEEGLNVIEEISSPRNTAHRAECPTWSPIPDEGACSCVPDLIFTESCKTHDGCYGHCGLDGSGFWNRLRCDYIFFNDMMAQCWDRYGFYSDRSGLDTCISIARIYFLGIVAVGGDAYDAAQACCGDDPPPSCGGDEGDGPTPRDERGPLDQDAEEGEAFPCLPGAICGGITGVAASDPNDKLGKKGVTLEEYIFGNDNFFSYQVRFENVDSATAAAQVVTILDTLDKTVFDLSSFSLGPFTIGSQIYQVPPGLSSYTQDIDLRPGNDLIVRLNAKLDTFSGVASWQFLSLDPQTKTLTDDPLAGFLPPNVISPEGEGSVSFNIESVSGLQHQTIIGNSASIVFDGNEAIITNTWINTLDKVAPTSSMMLLEESYADTTFTVQWGGTDSGSGVKYYDVFVSTDPAAGFRPWKSQTPKTESIFTGTVDSTYYFYSVATDKVGNVEQKLPISEASTTIMATLPSPVVSVLGETLICQGDSTTLLASEGYATYAWNTGDSSRELTVYKSGTYYVIGGNETGLSSASNQVVVEVILDEVPTISLQGNHLAVNLTGDQYAWYLNGEFLSQSVDPRLEVLETGSYTVQVQIGDCFSPFSAPFELIQTNLIKEEQKIFKVYPNPASTIIYIDAELTLVNDLFIKLFNQLGQEVARKHILPGRNSINTEIGIAHLPAGLYSIHFDFGGKKTVQKVWIRR